MARRLNVDFPGAQLLSLEEVANMLGRSKRSIYRYAKSHALQGVKSGGRWFFDSADVAAWLREGASIGEPSIEHVPSEWEKEYGPKFQAFVRGLSELNPDYLVFMERKAAKLVGYLGGIPEAFEGKVLMYDALTYLSRDDIEGRFFVVIDDTVQHGRSLRQVAQSLLDAGAANVVPIAFARCTEGVEVDPGAMEIKSHLELPEEEFSRFTAGTIDFLKTLRRPLDVDHPVVEVSISVEDTNWVGRFIEFLSQFGEVFFVPTPAEIDRVLELTLHKPSFFVPLTEDLPGWVELDDWYKLRIQLSVDPATLVLVPIVIASVRLSEFEGQPCGLDDMPMRTCERVSGYWDQKPNDGALHCRRCISNHLAAVLLEKFLRLMVQAERRLKLHIDEAKVTNREELKMMYGPEAGNGIALDLEGHVSKALKVAGRIPVAQPVIPGVVELLTSRAAVDKRSLGAWIEALPLVGLLAERRLEAEAESVRLEDRWRGLTIGEIRSLLGDQHMSELQVSRAIDFMLDNSVIVPHDYVRGDAGMAVRGFVAGELNRGSYDSFLPDPPLGGAAKDDVSRRFGKDMVRIPLALDLAMGHFGFRDGMAVTISEKLLANLLFDDIIPADDTFLRRTADRFGATVHCVSGPAGDTENIDLRTLTRYGPFVRTRAGQHDVYRPTAGWQERLGQLQGTSDEIARTDQHIELMAAVFKRVGRRMRKGSDALVILASCRDDDTTYFHVYTDLRLWVKDFCELLEMLSDAEKRKLKDPKAVVEYTQWAAGQVVWKVDAFRSLAGLAEEIDGLYPRVGALQERAKAVVKTLVPTDVLSDRLVRSRMLGEAMSSLSAAAKARLMGNAAEAQASLTRCRETFGVLGLEFPSCEASSEQALDLCLQDGYVQLREYVTRRISQPTRLQPRPWDEIDLLQLHVATKAAMREQGMEISGVFLYIDGSDSTFVTATASSESEVEGQVALFYHQVRESVLPDFAGTMKPNNGGDDCLIIFKNAEDAVRAAAEIRRAGRLAYAIEQLPWPLRMGMDMGDAFEETFSRTSSAISIAAHIADLGEPWDILLSQRVKDAMVDCPLPLRERPPLKIGDNPVGVWEVAE